MRWIDSLRRRLRALMRSGAVDGDLRDEMQAHLDQLVQQHLDAGLSPGDARTAALREFGGTAAIVDDSRDSRGVEWAHRAIRELRWAWRGVRARGWRAVFVVAIIGVALAANATMFSVVDSLVFNQHPFADPDRIVTFTGHTDRSEARDAAGNSALLARWREQTDVIAAIGGYMYKNIFVMHDGTSDLVPTADFTPAMLNVLGASPKWGRGFVEADTKFEGAFAALIREDLARQRFGSPRAALGQRLEASGAPLVVVGVMPMQFAFPDAHHQVWRAFDPNGPLTYMHGVTYVARLRSDVPVDAAIARLTKRAPDVGRLAGFSTYTAEAKPMFPPPKAASRDTVLLVLLGAGLCLLLTACASVTNVELAVAVPRAQTHAVQLALGASRASLGRVAALEGAILIGGAMTAGLGLAKLSIDALASILPESLSAETQNPSHLSARVAIFTVAAALLSWALASLPAVLAAVRSDLATLIKTENRSSSGSRASGRIRRWLTVAEVAMAVALIVGGLMYARSYQHLLSVEKGFNSRGVVEISMSMPRSFFPNPTAQSQFKDRLMTSIRAVPGVLGVTNSMAPPALGSSFAGVSIEVDGQPLPRAVTLNRKFVDADYFRVLGLPLKSGRFLDTGDPANNAIIGEALAMRLWPHDDAVGHTLTLGTSDVHVVGVVGDFRTEATKMPDADDARVLVYSFLPALTTSPSTPANGPAEIDPGSSYAVAAVTVRLSSLDRLSELVGVVRRVDPSLQATFTPVDDIYAKQNVDTRLASQVVGGFSAVAFLIAIAGIYGVMAFLVAGRRREIGIRMALGAGRHAITRMVLGSSSRLVLAGAIGGAVVALISSRWIKAQLFGVSPTNPLIYLSVAAVVFVVAMLATWQPARRAARIDPAIALRAE